MKINLYSTYFVSDHAERQKEIDYCLLKNIENIYFNRVNIFVENKALAGLSKMLGTSQIFAKHNLQATANKLNLIILDKIPSYKDWLDISGTKNEISVFANADIYFDESINKAFNYLKNEKSLICLSRHEVLQTQIVPHQNPKWSQDAWVINSNTIQNIDFLDKLDLSTGKCRCDNKLAYYFAINGWDLYNPFMDIKCYHKHDSKLRNYNKKTPDIFGSLAFVHPTKTYDPSIVDICVMPKKNLNINQCLLSTFLYE
jgi:hypothetical protein